MFKLQSNPVKFRLLFNDKLTLCIGIRSTPQLDRRHHPLDWLSPLRGADLLWDIDAFLNWGQSGNDLGVDVALLIRGQVAGLFGDVLDDLEEKS